MKPTTEILAKISQNSLANKEEVFTKLYRYLLRPDIYFVAYKNLYANSGATAKGVNEDTADGFSEAKIDSIIKALADETYQPIPVRRTYKLTGACLSFIWMFLKAVRIKYSFCPFHLTSQQRKKVTTWALVHPALGLKVEVLIPTVMLLFTGNMAKSQKLSLDLISLKYYG